MGISSLGQAIELYIGSAHRARLIQFDNTFEMPAGASNGGSQRRHVSTLWFWRLGEALRATDPMQRERGSNEASRGPLRLPFICWPIDASVALSCLWQDRNHDDDYTCNCLRW